MRKLIVTGIALAIASLAIPLTVTNVQALAAPAALAAAMREASQLTNIVYVCRRVWRCGPNACGWRNRCWDNGAGYGYGPGYGAGYGPGYGAGYGPGPGYGYYGGRRWNTWNGCPPYWTIQDGVCKPYRGY
jgi:hypothetical protein